jgi:DNA-directed RNA polymerase specialized sigma24 family protein
VARNASTAAAAAIDEAELVEGLRQRERHATLAVLDMYDTSMVRLAMSYGHLRTAAEQLVNETWSEIYDAVREFDGTVPLKPWLFRQVAERSAADAKGNEDAAVPARPAMDPRRFYGSQTRWPGHWREQEDFLPRRWSELAPSLSDDDRAAYLQSAIALVRGKARQVVLLRDEEGWTPEEVQLTLDLADDEQEELLARARGTICVELERRLKEAARQ